MKIQFVNPHNDANMYAALKFRVRVWHGAAS
jgi:hypothetical protein